MSGAILPNHHTPSKRTHVYTNDFILCNPKIQNSNGSEVCRPRCVFNLLTPNDPYSGRTAPLTSKRCILYIYLTNIGTEYFKYGIYSPFFSLQNAVCFIILTYLVPVLFTFYIQGVLKLKKISAPKCLPMSTSHSVKHCTFEGHLHESSVRGSYAQAPYYLYPTSSQNGKELSDVLVNKIRKMAVF